MSKLDPELHERLKVLASSMGYELVGAELLPQGRQMMFRIYIDGPNGVTVDDCSKISRQVGAMLDVEDPFHIRYILEVSSPGIDRPLFELEHYRKYIGKQIKVKLRLPVEGRKQYKGLLQKVEGDDIYLMVSDTEQPLKVSFSNIDKANLVGEINFR